MRNSDFILHFLVVGELEKYLEFHKVFGMF